VLLFHVAMLRFPSTVTLSAAPVLAVISLPFSLSLSVSVSAALSHAVAALALSFVIADEIRIEQRGARRTCL